MKSNDAIVKILDYILNRADARDLEAIEMALQKRRASRAASSPGHIQDLDFRQMAQEAVKSLSGKYGADQDEIHLMTRRLVAGMIKEKMPGIPARDMEALLDQWVPNGKGGGGSQGHNGRENVLPDEMVLSMIDQFVRYSLNVMSEQEIRELVASAENWYEKYWEIFSLDTKQSIKDLLDRKMDLHQFWERTKNRIRFRNS